MAASQDAVNGKEERKSHERTKRPERKWIEETEADKGKRAADER